MFQPDLFAAAARVVPEAAPPAPQLDLPAVLNRLSETCERPRYSFMVLQLIAQASDRTGWAGPWIERNGHRVSVRDWLSDALTPVARRDPRRKSLAARARADLEKAGALPVDPEAAERAIEAEVQHRIRLSGRTNVSRAVSELVRAGLVRRHYQGFRVDHHNRGAQRHAVYAVTEEARLALQTGA
ncbi:hypothetical protein [Sphingomonas sp. TDK1]|uniref:hypothetical protein n=1 Tax=Sphingomonas sp. TDK1 TaxID=453247 RepID=UPI0007DA085A|nr:hypothetical protein [Sphingomonas sp. TDK1]OAN62227.1 hypothetical protein A7X12_22300 [Sphingomonas sp. TDK1]